MTTLSVYWLAALCIIVKPLTVISITTSSSSSSLTLRLFFFFFETKNGFVHQLDSRSVKHFGEPIRARMARPHGPRRSIVERETATATSAKANEYAHFIEMQWKCAYITMWINCHSVEFNAPHVWLESFARSAIRGNLMATNMLVKQRNEFNRAAAFILCELHSARIKSVDCITLQSTSKWNINVKKHFRAHSSTFKLLSA